MHEVDPKFFRVMFKLHRKEIQSFINKPGFLRFETNKKIKLYYTSDEMLNNTLDKI